MPLRLTTVLRERNAAVPRRRGGGLLALAVVAAVLSACAGTAGPLAAQPDPVALNHVQATLTIASAGMPTRSQLAKIAASGVAVVINLVPTGAMGSHDDEQAIVERAGTRYVHVPVDFGGPRHEDYARFAREMRAVQGRPVFVHCQMNMRASVFVFLYRTLELGEDPDRAFEDVLRVWQPNAVWSGFLRSELGARGVAVPLAAS